MALTERLTSRFCGEAVLKHRGVMRLTHPTTSGVITDWDDLSFLWSEAIGGVGVRTRDHPMLVTEAPLTPAAQRERLASHMFETLEVPAVHFSAPSTLALYATGRTTGVVLDVGDGVLQAVPVYEGLALAHGLVRSDLGGRTVTARMHYLLRASGLVLDSSSGAEVVREIKEVTGSVALDPRALEEQVRAGRFEGPEYRLPDGRTFRLGPEVFRAPEVLFTPSVAGLECAGAADAVFAAVQSGDLAVRPALWSNIVLAGGATLTRGFGHRMLAELRRQAPAGTKVRITAPADRAVLAWVGGSILASLSTFRSMWITREQYAEEGGRALLHRHSL